MATSRKTGAVPWVVAGAAGVVLAALLLVYFAVLLPDKNDSGGFGNLTRTEQGAVTGAATRAVNLTSYRRAHFAADWARAVGGTTGTLHTETDTTKAKAALQKNLVAAKTDVGATVTHASLENSSKKGYVVLVSLNVYHTSNKAQTAPQNLEITMVRKKGAWLASDLQAVNLGAG